MKKDKLLKLYYKIILFFIDKRTYDYEGWKCNDLHICKFIKIHWHDGPNEFYKKPKIRLRSIRIFNYKLPLKYYAV